MSNFLKNTLLIGSGFAGGLLAGHYLTSVSEKKTIANLIGRADAALSELILKHQNVMLHSGEKIHAIQNKLRKELSSPIPDLYKATESLSLDFDDLDDV